VSRGRTRVARVPESGESVIRTRACSAGSAHALRVVRALACHSGTGVACMCRAGTGVSRGRTHWSGVAGAEASRAVA
jgi:hypothetical protein